MSRHGAAVSYNYRESSRVWRLTAPNPSPYKKNLAPVEPPIKKIPGKGHLYKGHLL